MPRSRLAFLSSVVFAGALPLAALACGGASSDATGAQESNHTEGEITSATHPWLWANESDAELAEATAADPKTTWLPASHPLTLRLQFWADALDAALRSDAALKPALEAIPRPKIAVAKSETINAWANKVGVRWNAPGKLERDVPKDAPATPDALFHLKRTGKLVATSDAAFVVTRPHDRSTLEQFVSFHNAGFTDCKLATDGRTVRFGAKCLVDYTVASNDSAAIGYVAMSSRIGLTTALVAALDEPRAVAVVAHELGHYYRAHATVPIEAFNFFYALDGAPAGKRPLPDARFADATRIARDKLRQDRWVVDFPQENALIVRERLGFYTTEQEADELSLELLARVGLSPELGPESQLALMGAVERSGRRTEPGTLGLSECLALKAKDFRDAKGAEVAVPVGDLANPHHSACFRVFNMTHDLRGHAYTIAEKPPSPPGEAWATLLASLER